MRSRCRSAKRQSGSGLSGEPGVRIWPDKRRVATKRKRSCWAPSSFGNSAQKSMSALRAPEREPTRGELIGATALPVSFVLRLQNVGGLAVEPVRTDEDQANVVFVVLDGHFGQRGAFSAGQQRQHVALDRLARVWPPHRGRDRQPQA